MRTGLEVMKERGMNMEQDSWDGNEFAAACLPMVAACRICGMTMAFTSVMVQGDDGGTIYCRTCAPDGDLQW